MVSKTPLTYEEKQRLGYRVVSWTQTPEDQILFDEIHELLHDSMPFKLKIHRTDVLRYACERLLELLKEH